MQILFPNALDPLNLVPDVATKNAGDDSAYCSDTDVIYALDAIEKKLGVNGSQDVASIDYRVTQLEAAASGTVLTSPLTTKGDLLTFDTVLARIGVGTDGYVLTADSTATTGLKWAAGGGVSTGNLTELTSAILTITGGTGAVVGSGTSITVTKADATHNGYLSSTDWNTFSTPVISSVSNSDGTITISPTTGVVVASIALAHANSWTGLQTMQFNSIGVTSTDGLALVNLTAATSGLEQWSPRFRLTGNSWNLSGTPASHPMDWIMENQTSKSAGGGSVFTLGNQKNGGGYNRHFAVDESGRFYFSLFGAQPFTGQSMITPFDMFTNNGGSVQNTIAIYNIASMAANTGNRIIFSANASDSGQGMDNSQHIYAGIGAQILNNTTQDAQQGDVVIYTTPMNPGAGSGGSGMAEGARFVGGGGFTLSPQTVNQWTTVAERITVSMNMNATLTYPAGGGTIAQQRSMLVQAKTYAALTNAVTITKAGTLVVDKAPVASTNVTITNAYALWVQAGLTQLDGGLTVVGNSSLGTITTGVWNGTTIAVANGGTASTSLGTSLTNAGAVLNTIQGIRTTDTPQWARIGLGQAADAGAVMAATGQYFSALYGCSTTLNWNNGNVQAITLANGAQTFTFSNPKSGARYILILKQPSSGAAGTVTWPTIKWVGRTTPALTATNSNYDLVSLIYDGTNYYGQAALNF